MSQLNHLELQGFKSIQRLDLPLGAVNVLIGPNGAGKSNVVSFFRLLEAIVRRDLQLFVQRAGRAEALLYYGPQVTPRLKARLSFSRGEYAFTLGTTEDSRLVFEYEAIGHDGGSEQLFGPGHEEAKLHEALDQKSNSLSALTSMRAWKVYHFHDTGRNAPPKQAGSLNDNERLHSDAGNLAAFLYLLREKHPSNYDLIRRTVQRIFPRFGDFALRPDPLSPETIRLEWREHGEEYLFGPHQLSDGTLRFICLATLLLQPSLPTTVIIDEPELGLHPRALGVLAGLVRSAAAQTQVILTTQSVTFLDQFEPRDVIVVEREEGSGDGVAARARSTFRRLEDEAQLDQWLDEYTLGELWEMNMLGGRP